MAHQFDLDGVDLQQIGRLMEVLAESDVEECEIEQGEFRLSLRRGVGVPAAQGLAPGLPQAEGQRPEEPLLIGAPAVGVFSRGNQPSGHPVVEVGARVKPGDVLGFIEVMMIPHSVFSTHDGVIESFLVEDGQPVEYGQPLVRLSPAAHQAPA